MQGIAMEYEVKVDLNNFPSSYGLSSPVPYLDPSSKVHIIHANVHSCSSAVKTPCTPSVRAQPGLATHSSTLKSNFTGTSKLEESFTSSFTLGEDSYTMIAHGRFFLSSSNNDTVRYKWDLANGKQIPPSSAFLHNQITNPAPPPPLPPSLTPPSFLQAIKESTLSSFPATVTPAS